MIFMWIGLFLILILILILILTEDIKISVCASQESFNTLVPRGICAKGAVFLEKLFLSPRAFETDTHQGILTH
tara:strand:+ start:277 stop:495 length:219 start_codon:yes stop_codon:yes gene_type:complete